MICLCCHFCPVRAYRRFLTLNLDTPPIWSGTPHRGFFIHLWTEAGRKKVISAAAHYLPHPDTVMSLAHRSQCHTEQMCKIIQHDAIFEHLYVKKKCKDDNVLITEHTYFIVTPTQCKTTCIQMYKKGASPYRVIPTLTERSRRGKKKQALLAHHISLFQPSGWIAVSLHSHSWPPHRHITVQ